MPDDQPVNQEKALRIALLSDTHTVCNSSDPDRRLYKGRFDRAIAQVNAANVDLVLIAGDLTNDGARDEAEDFQSQAKSLSPPVHCVPGNHDVGDKHRSEKPGEGATSKRVAQFEKRIGPNCWTIRVRPLVGSAAAHPEPTPEDVRAAVRRAGLSNVRVIGINASILGSGLPEETLQWTFLEKELQRSRTPRTLLLSHYPPFLQTPDEPGDPYWNVEPEPRARLLALLQQPKARVVGILSGHLHRSNDVSLGNIRLVTTPPIAFGLPPGVQPEGWTLVTIPSRGGIRTEFQPLQPTL